MTARIPNSSMKSTLQEKIIQVIQDVVASRYYQEEIVHGPLVGEAIAMAGRKALDGNLTSPHRKPNGVRMQTYSPSTEWPSATQNGSRSRLRLTLTSSYSYSSYICGGIHIRTRTSQLCHDQNVGGNTKKEDERVLQTQTVFVWHPAPWLFKWCCSYGLKVEILRKFLQQGWKQSLNTYRAVPDDAIIFGFCREESISAVGKLIQAGQASVWDTDSCGRTPLHVGLNFIQAQSIECIMTVFCLSMQLDLQGLICVKPFLNGGPIRPRRAGIVGNSMYY